MNLRKYGLMFALSAALISCSNSHTAIDRTNSNLKIVNQEDKSKRFTKSHQEKVQAAMHDYEDQIAKSRFVVGKSYDMMGGSYKPKVNLNYNETGYALYYASKFHGKQTASGPIYDENIFTAAHRTLPLPSIVKVSNLENGREIVVIISDRGPFACGDKSIIDLSRSAANALGIIKKGKAKVRLQYLHNETLELHTKLPEKEKRKASFAINVKDTQAKKIA